VPELRDCPSSNRNPSIRSTFSRRCSIAAEPLDAQVFGGDVDRQSVADEMTRARVDRGPRAGARGAKLRRMVR
jgi:hypothetical protein